MTQEELHKYINDLSNRIIPHLLDSDIDLQLNQLSIVDLIVVYKNANYSFKVKMFMMSEQDWMRFEQKIKEIYSLLIEKIKNADKLYVPIDMVTRMPYLGKGNCIFVCADRSVADETVDYYRTHFRRNFRIEEISGANFKDTFGMYFYMNGAEGIIIGDLEITITIKNNELVSPPDFSNVSKANIPVMNPKLKAALANYVQRNDKASEDALIDAFCEAEYLVPNKGLSMNGGLEALLNSKIIIPHLSNGINNATPIFTDWEQFNKIFSQNEWNGWVWSAEDLMSAPEKTIILNAGETSYVMTREKVEEFFKIYKSRKSSDK